jgi:hypothetical protein
MIAAALTVLLKVFVGAEELLSVELESCLRFCFVKLGGGGGGGFRRPAAADSDEEARGRACSLMTMGSLRVPSPVGRNDDNDDDKGLAVALTVDDDVVVDDDVRRFAAFNLSASARC